MYSLVGFLELWNKPFPAENVSIILDQKVGWDCFLIDKMKYLESFIFTLCIYTMTYMSIIIM